MADRLSKKDVVIPVIAAGFAVVTAWSRQDFQFTYQGSVIAYSVLVAAAIATYVWLRRDDRLAKVEESKKAAKENADRQKEELEREERWRKQREKEREEERRIKREQEDAERQRILAEGREKKFNEVANSLPALDKAAIALAMSEGLKIDEPGFTLHAAAVDVIKYENGRLFIRDEFREAAMKWMKEDDVRFSVSFAALPRRIREAEAQAEAEEVISPPRSDGDL